MINWKKSTYALITAANIYGGYHTHHKHKKNEKALKQLLVDSKTGKIDFATIAEFTIDELLQSLK